MLQSILGTNANLWIPITIICVLVAAVIIHLVVKGRSTAAKPEGTEDEAEIYEIIKDAGYSYDSKQDIFYSILDPWQRKMGYCRLFDEASAPLNMIIDCEPIYFEYGGKRWLIEFWKGQYALCVGGEIGVYNTDGPDLNLPGIFNGTFYDCAGNGELLYMSFALVRNGEILLRRSGRHWWLTGFKLGEFAEPSELIMYLSIGLKNVAMRKAFVKGLIGAGYSDYEIMEDGSIVSLVFGNPRTPQPLSRIPETDWMIQRKNEYLCAKYQEITNNYDSFPEKMAALKEQAPELYDTALSIGKARELFKGLE